MKGYNLWKQAAKGYASEKRFGTTNLVRMLRMSGAKPLFTMYTFAA